MIRVNLAKSHSFQSTGTQTAIAMDQASLAMGPHPVVKVILILIFPVLLYFYESYNLSEITKRYVQKQDELQQIQNEVTQFGSVSNVVGDLMKEKKQLDDQLAVIQKISQKRAFKLKAIQFIQESVLEDLWLKKMVVSDDSLEIEGFSITPTSVQKIVKTLSSAEFIEDGINQEIRRVQNNDGELNTFKILAKVKD